MHFIIPGGDTDTDKRVGAGKLTDGRNQRDKKEKKKKKRNTHSSPSMGGHEKVAVEVVGVLHVAPHCSFPPSLTAS